MGQFDYADRAKSSAQKALENKRHTEAISNKIEYNLEDHSTNRIKGED